MSVVQRNVKIKRELRDLPKPEPSAGLDMYNDIREKALALDSRKRGNYDKYMASRRREAKLDYLPIKLDIENVSRCNLKCSMCVVSDWDKGVRGEDMSLDDFKKIIDEQFGLVEIKLQGLGEPVLQGKDFFDMIRYARAKNIWVRTTTNATRLHLKAVRSEERFIYQELIDSDANEIQISIDGATREVHEGIRQGAVFGQITENCKLINAYSREKGVRVTKMWSVIQMANQHQLFDLVDLAHELGFRDQTFAFSLTNWGQDEWRQRNDAVTVEENLDHEIAWKLVEKGEKLGIRVSFWNSTDKYNTSNRESLCAWPFERAVITSDLRTVPCCTIGSPDSYELGRGQGKGFTELWFSEEYEAFRQAHLDGKIPEVCLPCYGQNDE